MTKPYPTVDEVSIAIGFHDSAWGFIEPAKLIQKICDLDRKREAPADERIDWAAMPWAVCVAADEDGRAYAWEIEPVRHRIYPEWAPKHGDNGRVARINATILGPWQDSLRARPAGI